MFEMKQVGRTIATRRKELNLTQMELADHMGVSFQAVSNWERGNSMPDISKLPDLAALLGVSLDDLLSAGETARFVQHIVDGDAHEYIQKGEVSAETAAQVAPILKPDQAESILEEVLQVHGDEVDLSDLTEAAPFVSDSFLESWAVKIASVDNIGDLSSIAPFLSKKTLDLLVDKLEQDAVTIRALIPLAPFLSSATLDKLSQRCIEESNLSDLTGLAPFLSENALDNIIHRMSQKDGFSVRQITGLAPFLSESALDHLCSLAINDANLSDIKSLAPFLSKKTLDGIVYQLSQRDDFSIRQVKGLAPFLSENALDHLCSLAISDADPSDIVSIAPFLSKKSLNDCAEKLVARFGIKGIKGIAPFL